MDRQYFKQNVSHPQTFHGTVGHVFDMIIKTVGSTYGPGGTHNIFMMGPGEINASKDGFENLSMMRMDSTIASTVHQMAIEVAQRQASIVGDGTTSAILIMAQVYKQLRDAKHIWQKYTPSAIHKAMKQIQDGIVMMLKNAAAKVEDHQDVFYIAYTSTDRNFQIADVITQVYNKQPEEFADMNVMLDYSGSDQTYQSTSQGFSLNGRMMHKGFNNHDVETCRFKDTQVVVIDGAVTITNDIVDYANQLKLSGKSLLIICSGIKNENFFRYIETLSQRQPQILNNIAVFYATANTIQDSGTYYDLVKSTGCSHLEEGFELNKDTIEEIAAGYAGNVMIKGKTLTLGGFKQTEEFDSYLETIQDQIKEAQAELENPAIARDDVHQHEVKINRLKARYAKLKQGTTTIFVGGETNQRRTINYRLAEDGIKAAQSAVKTGYFSGCNTTTMNVLYEMMIKQKQTNPAMDDIFSDLIYVVLRAYLEVYGKLITNRIANMELEQMSDLILRNDIDKSILKINGNKIDVDINTDLENQPVFAVVNLADEDDEHAGIIINPASTDILIVEKAIDAALVLATANTIMTDDNTEFESE